MAEENLDLNGEGSTDYGDKTPLLPFGEGRYLVLVRKFMFHKGYKGKAYRCKYKVIESDRKDVKEGYEYMTHLKVGGDKPDTEKARLRAVRSFVAAMFSADPADKGFDANDAQKTLLELSAADQLGDGEGQEQFVIEIVCRDKQISDAKTKALVFNADGSPKMITNQFYNPKPEPKAAA